MPSGLHDAVYRQCYRKRHMHSLPHGHGKHRRVAVLSLPGLLVWWFMIHYHSLCMTTDWDSLISHNTGYYLWHTCMMDSDAHENKCGPNYYECRTVVTFIYLHGSLNDQIGYFSALPASKQCKICQAGTISVIGALAAGSVSTVNGIITIETASTDMVDFVHDNSFNNGGNYSYDGNYSSGNYSYGNYTSGNYSTGNYSYDGSLSYYGNSTDGNYSSPNHSSYYNGNYNSSGIQGNYSQLVMRVITKVNGTITTGAINGTINGTITYMIRSNPGNSHQSLLTLINNGSISGMVNATLTSDLDGKMYSIMNGLVLVINASEGTIKVINASAASGIYFAQFPGSSNSYTTGPSQELGMLDLTGKPGADACFPCPAGFFQYAVGGSMCHPCPFGTYSSSIGSNNCTPCSPGTASARLALTAACPSCPANFYAKYDNTKTCM